jgi:ubiquinone/menaquinone biosynthesis C-methylase UbiE
LFLNCSNKKRNKKLKHCILKKQQLRVINEIAKVHIVAWGDRLPFTNESVDFVINFHVLEHFFDPIKAIQEWLRVVKKGGR